MSLHVWIPAENSHCRECINSVVLDRSGKHVKCQVCAWCEKHSHVKLSAPAPDFTRVSHICWECLINSKVIIELKPSSAFCIVYRLDCFFFVEQCQQSSISWAFDRRTHYLRHLMSGVFGLCGFMVGYHKSWSGQTMIKFWPLNFNLKVATQTKENPIFCWSQAACPII